MWKIFRNPLTKATRMDSISVTDFVHLLKSVPDKILIFDVRDCGEIEANPHMIPRALLASDLSLLALMPWLPPHMLVVLYGTDCIPRDYECLRALRPDARFYVLEGGLRAWREARLGMEGANLYPIVMRKPHD